MKKVNNLLKTAMLAIPLMAQSAWADPQTDADNYLAAGNQILDMINTNTVDVAKLEPLVVTMVTSANNLAKVYMEKFPGGDKLLEEIMSNSMQGGQLGKMSTLSFGDIEHQWHDMGFALENEDKFGIDISDEDNEHYTDPAHVIIHPVMTLVAAIEGAKSGADRRDDMKGELTEGIEQLELMIPKLR